MSFTVSGTGLYKVQGSGQMICGVSSSGFSNTAEILLNGTNSYLEWSDESGIGDIGSLAIADTSYSFGFQFRGAWQGASFEFFSLLTRGAVAGFAFYNTTSINVQGVGWEGADGASGSNGFATDVILADGDTIQFNCDTSDYNVYIYINGVLKETSSMASLRTQPQNTGVLRFGFDLPLTTWSQYHGSISGLWMKTDGRFSDGAVGLYQYTNNGDILGATDYGSVTSFFNLGADTYPSIVDLKGNLADGTLVNGISGDFTA